MTNREMLQNYRAAVIDLQELAVQLERTGGNGRPRGIQSIRYDAIRGTNDPAAAALQAAEGIEEMIDRKRDELAAMMAPIGTLMSQIGNYRTLMVIQRYYLHGSTDAVIAQEMCMSRARVNQIRNDYIDNVG